MAIRNGGAYLMEQVDSILSQLKSNDELIISDDHSKDTSKELIKSYHDGRIRQIDNPRHGLVSNFEHALNHARGDYIFLSDQDDVWCVDKVKRMTELLATYGLVVCDCNLVNSEMNLLPASYFERLNSGKGLVKNLLRNSYMGCCMAFQRKVLEKALPFPPKLAMHDQWIGLVAEVHSSVFFLHEPLTLHRRHHQNASTTFSTSTYSIPQRISMRFHTVRHLIRAAHA